MYVADARHPNSTLEDKLRSIYELRGGPSIDLTIRKPYLDLLAALGNPHQSLPPVIHVAGTNGKGSVIAILRSIFETAGYNVHTYTSPHLVRFNERIALAGQEISDDYLEGLLDETLAANQGADLTFFEITTALAFLAFSRTKADICLLETGLGGRLDCTNIIEKPLATIITRIGFDHMEFLGETLQQIATEKAGIIKTEVPCILAPQTSPDIDAVFEQKAKERNSPLIKADTRKALPTNLTGPHQQENMAATLACLQQISGFDISQKAIETALQNVSWPGRLQQISHPDLPLHCELWFDGGHNESAAKAIATQAALWQKQDDKPLHLMLGMMKTKDPQAFIKPLQPYLHKITCIDIPGEPMAFAAQELAKVMKPSCTGTNYVTDINEVIANAENERMLIAGSLYLAGNVLNLFKKH